jgi:hypothetical protein
MMRDWGTAADSQLRLAETLGFVMARRAAEILERHRPALTRESAVAGPLDAGPLDAGPLDAGPLDAGNDAEFDADNAIFTAVLDAVNECLGRYDTRPADERWCDALLQLIYLANG